MIELNWIGKQRTVTCVSGWSGSRVHTVGEYANCPEANKQISKQRVKEKTNLTIAATWQSVAPSPLILIFGFYLPLVKLILHFFQNPSILSSPPPPFPPQFTLLLQLVAPPPPPPSLLLVSFHFSALLLLFNSCYCILLFVGSQFLLPGFVELLGFCRVLAFFTVYSFVLLKGSLGFDRGWSRIVIAVAVIRQGKWNHYVCSNDVYRLVLALSNYHRSTSRLWAGFF